MRLAGALIVVFFLGALGFSVVRGVQLVERGRAGREALDDRIQQTLTVERDLSPPSYAEVSELVATRSRLADQVGQRASILVDGVFPAPTPPLDEVLRTTRFASLDKQRPLRAALLDVTRGRPRVEEAVARLLDVLHEAGVEELETIVVRNDGALLPVEGLPRLRQLEIELVLVSETPEVLEVVERLVPGSGEPVLTVRSASLRRIEPSLWADSTAGRIGPPVRLVVTVAALFDATPAHRRGGTR